MRLGTLPIVAPTGGLKDTVEAQSRVRWDAMPRITHAVRTGWPQRSLDRQRDDRGGGRGRGVRGLDRQGPSPGREALPVGT